MVPIYLDNQLPGPLRRAPLLTPGPVPAPDVGHQVQVLHHLPHVLYQIVLGQVARNIF